MMLEIAGHRLKFVNPTRLGDSFVLRCIRCNLIVKSLNELGYWTELRTDLTCPTPALDGGLPVDYAEGVLRRVAETDRRLGVTRADVDTLTSTLGTQAVTLGAHADRIRDLFARLGKLEQEPRTTTIVAAPEPARHPKHRTVPGRFYRNEVTGALYLAAENGVLYYIPSGSTGHQVAADTYDRMRHVEQPPRWEP